VAAKCSEVRSQTNQSVRISETGLRDFLVSECNTLRGVFSEDVDK
jgi:hypothetical protein